MAKINLEISETAQSLPNFIWHYLKDKKLYLLGFVFVALVWAIDMSLSPYLLKVIVDNVVRFSSHKTEVLSTIILPAIFYASMSLIINLTFRLYDYINLKLYPYLRASIERDLLQKKQKTTRGVFRKIFQDYLDLFLIVFLTLCR